MLPAPERDGTGLSLSVSLAGLPPDADLQLTLPGDYARVSLGQLLETVFPADEAARQAVEDKLDVGENPDLPDIYDCFLPVIDQHRRGLCSLKLTTGLEGSDSIPAQLFDLVSRHWQPPTAGSGDNPPCSRLALTIEPEYRALDYAVAQGYWESSAELLAWLQTHTLLYFLDKHEYRLPAPVDAGRGAALSDTVENLCHRNLLHAAEDTGAEDTGVYRITPAGRQFIGALLAETESYIDRFDEFKDVFWDEETGAAEFATGYGDDLRVPVFIAEGLDPVRTVFLLRLYDGGLDRFAATWPELIGDAGFFNRILEPVVNRAPAPEELLPAIIEDGYAYTEARDESDRESQVQARIARQVAGNSPNRSS